MAAQTYQHNQSTPSALWEITHNLGVYPIVDVYVNIDGNMEKILPKDIIRINDNVVNIEFSSPFAGVARIV